MSDISEEATQSTDSFEDIDIYVPDPSSGSEWEPNDSDLPTDDSDFDYSDTKRVDETLSQYLDLKILFKQKSKSDVWKYFGHLMRNGRVIKKCSSRIFCKLCLQKNSLKR